MRFSLTNQRHVVGFAVMISLATFCVGNVANAQQFRSPATAGKDGAVLGGLAGAILGGIAGHQNNETAGGVAIGGAVGAIAGGLLGKAEGQAQVQQYQYQQQVQQAYQERVGRAVSMQDVALLTQSGVSPNLILKQISDHGVTHRLAVSDIITLHKNGVSEPVINAMQDARLASAAPQTRVAVRPAPAVTHREMIYVQPAPPAGRIQIYHHGYHPHRGHYHHGW